MFQSKQGETFRMPHLNSESKLDFWKSVFLFIKATKSLFEEIYVGEAGGKFQGKSVFEKMNNLKRKGKKSRHKKWFKKVKTCSNVVQVKILA